MKVGHRLQEERLRQGLTLADVEYRSRIPIRQLRRLEAEDWASFGSMTYARSFLKRYGSYLEVDVRETLDALPQPVLGGAGDYRYLTDSFGNWIDPRQRLSLSTSPRSPKPAAAGTRHRTSAVVVFSVLVLATGLFAHHMIAEAEKVVAEDAEPAAESTTDVRSGTLANLRAEVSPFFEMEPASRRPVMSETLASPPSMDTSNAKRAIEIDD